MSNRAAASQYVQGNLLPLLTAAIALIVRLVYLVQLQESPLAVLSSMDSDYYLQQAGRILNGAWLGGGVYFQSGFLYPYVLALFKLIFGPSLLPVKIAHILIDSASAVMLMLLARRFFGVRAAWVAGISYAVFGPFIAGSAQPLLDLPLLLPLLGGIELYYRACDGKRPVAALLAGLLIGLVIVSRPYLLPLPFLFVVNQYRDTPGSGRPPCVRLALLATLGMTVVIALVAIRNRVVGGEWVLTSAGGGVVFYIGNNPEATGAFYTPEGLDIAHDPFNYAASTLIYPSRQLGRPVTWKEASSFWFKKGLTFWREQPSRALGITLKKAFLCLNNHEIGDNFDYSFLKSRLPFLRLPWPGFGIIAPFGLLGMILQRRRLKELLIPYSLALLVVVSQVGILVYTRHRYILAALLIFFGSAAVVAIWDRTAARKWRQLALPLAVLVVCGAFTNWPAGMADNGYASSLNLANDLWHAGRQSEALSSYAEALRLNPNFTEAARDLAIALEKRGETAAALRVLGEMFDRVSDFPAGHRMVSDLYAGAPPAGLVAEFNRLRTGIISAEEAVRLTEGYFHERRFLEGLETTYAALRLHPDSGILTGLAGYAEDHLGNFSEAAVLYGRAAQCDPGGTGWNSRQEVALGFVRLKNRDLRSAEETFRRAVALDPRSAEAQFGLGVVLKKTDRMPEAADAFQKSLSFAAPGDRWIARAGEELALINKAAK